MTMTRNAMIFLFFTAAVFSAHADIYKYKDSEGKWRYTDVPPRSDVKYDVLAKKGEDPNKTLNQPSKIMTKDEVMQAMAPPKADKAAVKDQKNTDSSKEKETAAKADAEKLKAAQLAVAQENAAIKEENCRAAKANLATYQQGGRIKKVNEKGEPAYLSDADIASGRVGAQKEVDQYCHS